MTKVLGEIRRRVSVAGFVTNAHTGRAVSGALVRIEHEGMPDQRTSSAPDGLYYFLGLRPGAWKMSVTLPSMGARFPEVKRDFVIEATARDPVYVDIALQPYVIQGRISEKGQNGIAMAEVMVKGSGEKCFSDPNGQYAIVGVEPVKPGFSRQVQVFAQGYRQLSKPAELDAETGTYKTLDFELERAGGRPVMKAHGSSR